MRVYLDNCCYNRPYDDQSQLRISIETQAKIYIQNMIKNGEIELVTSYVLYYENNCNRSLQKQLAIESFMEKYATVHITDSVKEKVRNEAITVMNTGIKEKDAYHVTIALFAKCDYFISTDDRLLKYKTDKIQMVSPCEFIRIIEGGCK